ncbi:mannitol dehydrogenase family protein [Streptomyces sp. SID13031]|uniref:mannitol dehydrogenase family protein n=1 Tax=Streptomyces sp. SID13031 TaxID=2706046 RepID=UPI0013C7C220|nr:mannitol dehydrogenase family protein [Streptomyces sp. SID13031]NEA36732.1 mannitol dehydrogenase family protein [Streptomyces sp. SID13031]
MSARLSLGSLPAVHRPEVDPGKVSVGIVHLGLGAFHRAHQAVFTEQAAAMSGATGWGICGVSQRSAAVREQLAPQDGLYSVLTRGPGDPSVRVIGSIREVLTAPEDPDVVVARIADPAVAVVTLTVTEKGYRAAAQGGLDLTDPEIQADLAGRPPRTVVGQLAAGLARRTGNGAGPLTIVSCDNLVANGPFLRRLVEDYAAASPDAKLLAEQLESARFPASMVDRIVPATTDADRDEAAALLGVRDEAVVVAEPFLQWVIEDDFAGPRPEWDKAGAILTRDVAPWEQAKLRMLNATHSMLAYLGALRGYVTIAEAVRDEQLAGLAAELMSAEVIPTLTPPDGLDLTAYGESVLERFANPALKHRTAQVAMDGSVKLPVRLLGTIRDRLADSTEPRVASLAVAAWMVYVAEATTSGTPLDDPQAARLQAALGGAGTTPAALVDALLGVESVFGADLPANAVFRSLLVEHVGQLTR